MIEYGLSRGKQSLFLRVLLLRGIFLLLLLLFSLFLFVLLLFLLVILLLFLHLRLIFNLLSVESAQELLDLGVLNLDLLEGVIDVLKGNTLIWLIDGSSLVFAGTKVLDFLAPVLNVRETQCGG